MSETLKKESLLIRKLRNPKAVVSALALLMILILLLLWFLMKPEALPSNYGHATKIKVESQFVFPQPQDKIDLSSPIAVSLYAGRFYVADSSAGKIFVFDRFGRHLFNFPVSTKDRDGRVAEGNPVGISVSSGKIFVSDLNSNSVLAFNLMGQPLLPFAPKRSGKPLTIKPAALYVWNQMYLGGLKVYLTDLSAHRFEVVEMDGTVDMVVGSKGKGDVQFLYPNGITADANQKIFVTDSENGKVQVFDSLGKFQFYFPAKKLLPPFPPVNLKLPRGIAVDDHGSVHVADAFLQKVFVFNGDGLLIGQYGDMGSGPDQFNLPNGVAVEGDTVAIADKANRRISVWRYDY